MSLARYESLALIRHTRAAIAAGICYGATDVPALPFDSDAARLIEEIAAWRPARVFTSDLRRCRVLADALAAAIGVAPKRDARLRELDFGAWEGMRWDDVPRDALDRWAADPLTFAAPGGESGAALIGRVSAFFHAEVLARGGRVAIVSHAGPLRVLIALAADSTVDLVKAGPALGSVTFLPLAPAWTGARHDEAHAIDIGPEDDAGEIRDPRRADRRVLP